MEAWAIINRVVDPSKRKKVVLEDTGIEKPTEYYALPDNSNVGIVGIIYPAEGMTHNGVKIT